MDRNEIGGRKDFIVQQEPTLADEVVRLLDKGEQIELTSESSSQQNQVRLILITSAKPLHNALSGYAPAVFALAGHDVEKSSLRLTAERIGITSGEIHVSLNGPFDSIYNVLKMFLVRNKKNHNPYQFKTLTIEASESSFNFQKSIKYTIDSLPFGLLPGHLMTLSSSTIDLLIKQFIKFKATPHVPGSKIDTPQLIKSIRPALKTLSSVTEFETKDQSCCDDLNNSQHPQLKPAELDSEENTWTLVELNKREVTYLIGKNGWKIETIRTRSGARVKVVPLNNHSQGSTVRFNDPNVTQYLRVTGTKSQVAKALKIIESEIEHFRLNEIVHY